jgi:hypothetical protein
MWRKGRPSEQEALQLTLVYLRINEPERRRALLALAERYAQESSPPIAQDNEDPDAQ